MSIIDDARSKIQANADEKYRKFSASLLPNINNLAGVRLPLLRKFAREIAKSDYETFLNCSDCQFMEETMLKGMVIGLLKEPPEKILVRIEKFIPEIDNWSVCDSFCCGLKFAKNNKKAVWNFLQKYLNSEKEFEIRFGVVMLLNFYIDEEYIGRVLEVLGKIETDDYYAEMAVAWAVSMCYVKFEAESLEFLKTAKLSKTIHNKSIQKIIESNRISAGKKAKLKLLKI